MSSSPTRSDGGSVDAAWEDAEQQEKEEDERAMEELRARIEELRSELSLPFVPACDRADLRRVRQKLERVGGAGDDDAASPTAPVSPTSMKSLEERLELLTLSAEMDDSTIAERQCKADELASCEEELALFVRHQELEEQVDALNDELDAVRGKGKKPQAKRAALEQQIEALEAELEAMELDMLGEEEGEEGEGASGAMGMEEEEEEDASEVSASGASGGGGSSVDTGAAAVPPVPESDAKRKQRIKAMKPRDVKKELKALGLSTQGQKGELAERLLAALQT